MKKRFNFIIYYPAGGYLLKRMTLLGIILLFPYFPTRIQTHTHTLPAHANLLKNIIRQSQS